MVGVGGVWLCQSSYGSVLVSHYYPTPIAESLNLLSDLAGGSGRHSASSYDTSSGISSNN